MSLIKKEVEDMATSSIDKNFVVRGSKQAEMFVNAIEESENARKHIKPSSISVEHLSGADTALKAMQRWKALYGKK